MAEKYFSIYTGAQIDEKLTPAYGEIYIHEGSTPQSIPNGTTYEKVINFQANGKSKNCTPDYTNNKITITKTGRYDIDGSMSFSSGTNNTDILLAAFLDGVEQENVHFDRTIGTIGSVGSAAISGFIEVDTVPLDLDIRVRHDNGTPVNLTFVYLNVNAERIDI